MKELLNGDEILGVPKISAGCFILVIGLIITALVSKLPKGGAVENMIVGTMYVIAAVGILFMLIARVKKYRDTDQF